MCACVCVGLQFHRQQTLSVFLPVAWESPYRLAWPLHYLCAYGIAYYSLCTKCVALCIRAMLLHNELVHMVEAHMHPLTSSVVEMQNCSSQTCKLFLYHVYYVNTSSNILYRPTHTQECVLRSHIACVRAHTRFQERVCALCFAESFVYFRQAHIGLI